MTKENHRIARILKISLIAFVAPFAIALGPAFRRTLGDSESVAFAYMITCVFMMAIAAAKGFPAIDLIVGNIKTIRPSHISTWVAKYIAVSAAIILGITGIFMFFLNSVIYTPIIQQVVIMSILIHLVSTTVERERLVSVTGIGRTFLEFRWWYISSIVITTWIEIGTSLLMNGG